MLMIVAGKHAIGLVAIAIALVSIGHFLIEDPTETGGPISPDTRAYLQMAEGEGVPAPYRWRILAPVAARLLPVEPLQGLRVVSYLSLLGGYFLTLWTIRRLGVGLFPATLALLAVFGRPAHLLMYSNPFLTDAPAVASVAVAAAAVALGSFALLVAATFGGMLAREPMMLLLSAWVPTRRWLRLLAAGVALLLTFAVVWALAPEDGNFVYIDSPSTNFALTIKAIMGWSFLWAAPFGFRFLTDRRGVQYLFLSGSFTLLAWVSVFQFTDTLRMLQPLGFLLAIGLALVFDRVPLWLGFMLAAVGLSGALTSNKSHLSVFDPPFWPEIAVGTVGTAVMALALYRAFESLRQERAPSAQARILM